MEAAWKCVDQGGSGAVGCNECGEQNSLGGVGVFSRKLHVETVTSGSVAFREDRDGLLSGFGRPGRDLAGSSGAFREA